MSPGWEDLIARVRGRAAHFVGRQRLIELARASDLVRLVSLLEEAYGSSLGVAPGSTPLQTELAVRRAAAFHLTTLARWSRQHPEILTPFFLDEDRRSVRAMLRGASEGSLEDERLAGLVPTPLLPERPLRELASQRSVGAVAARLSAWNHPFGSALLAMARDPKPDLLRLDLLLNQVCITKSLEAARRLPRGHHARRDLVAFVNDTADIENASIALQLAGQRTSLEPGDFFLRGGRHFTLESFLTVAKSPDADTGRAVLQRIFRATPFAPALAGPIRELENGMLAARVLQAVRNARLFPLGAAPVIAFVLRLRAEVRDLGLILWRLAVGATPPTPREILSVI